MVVCEAFELLLLLLLLCLVNVGGVRGSQLDSGGRGLGLINQVGIHPTRGRLSDVRSSRGFDAVESNLGEV